MDETSQSDLSCGPLQGTVADLEDDTRRAAALDAAFDYRGDVTMVTKAGQTIVGYVYDRQTEDSHAYVRVMPADGSGRITVNDEQVAYLVFSGRDTASGKSWETWVKQYLARRRASEDGGS